MLRENALHIATRSGTEDFKTNIDYITRFKQQHSKVYKTVLGECKSVESSNTEGMEEGTLHRISEGHRTSKFCGEWAVLHTATYKDTEFKEITVMVERIPRTG
jgi:hypothetical protein